jgi:hypothetical protein
MAHHRASTHRRVEQRAVRCGGRPWSSARDATRSRFGGSITRRVCGRAIDVGTRLPTGNLAVVRGRQPAHRGAASLFTALVRRVRSTRRRSTRRRSTPPDLAPLPRCTHALRSQRHGLPEPSRARWVSGDDTRARRRSIRGRCAALSRLDLTPELMDVTTCVSLSGRGDASREARRETARVVATRVRSWTGRAATSRATASGVPHVVTSGTRRTRVSEMRDAGAAAPPPSTRRALARRLPRSSGSA